MRRNVFKATILAIILLICFGSLGTVWGAEHSNTVEMNVASDYEWNLVIDGMVDQSLNFSLSQIVALPVTKVNADLYCFSSLVASGNWVGVRLSVLLEDAGLLDGAEYIQFVALDGYATFLDITTAMREDVIVAYELNGQSLPETLRLVLPNENGDKWIALITNITAVTVPVSAPGQPNLTPTSFREAAASSPQPSNESTQTIKEITVPPDVLPSQLPENSIIPLQEFLRAYNSQKIEPEPATPEPTTQEPTTPEVTEPTKAPMITTEVAIIVAVAVASIISIVSFWALRKRK